MNEPDFVASIRKEIRAGFGLVPFIGSGLSAASGILMGNEFTNYLTWTVFLCVAGEGRKPGRRWDLARQGWPKSPSDPDVAAARDWVAERFRKLCEEHYHLDVPLEGEKGSKTVGRIAFKDLGAEPSRIVAAMRRPLIPRILYGAKTAVDDDQLRDLWRVFGREAHGESWHLPPDASPTSTHHVEEAALRSLHDWRMTLHFLSRLRQVRGASSRWPRLIITEAADQSIIDKFNLHITRGRRPNLAHSMLCHLAGPARIRTVLTTNFDTLIEDAFKDLDDRFEVIPVHITGTLPHPDTVHSLNCVIKLHGALTGTRADYSLDDPPSEDDKRRLFHYVRGCDPYDQEPGAGYLPSHLLVVGYSGSDARCVQMIKFLLDLDPGMKVFWICFSQADLARLWSTTFPEAEYRETGRIIAVVSRCPDLLFYELYQELMLCLPRGGTTYQLSPHMPPGRDYRATPESDNETLAADTKSIIDALQRLNPTGTPPAPERKRASAPPGRAKAGVEPEPGAATAPTPAALGAQFVVVDAASGTTAPLRRAFLETTSSIYRAGLWLELEDYLNIPHLAHEILQTIAVRIGRFQLDHAAVVPMGGATHRRQLKRWLEGWRRHCALMFATWGFRPASWLIVLYGRNGPGGCAGWKQNYWDRETAPDLLHFIDALAALDFRVLYAPYSRDRYVRDQRKEESIALAAQALCSPKGRKAPPRHFFEEPKPPRDFTDPDADFRVSCEPLFAANRQPISMRPAKLAVEYLDFKRLNGRSGEVVHCHYVPEPSRYRFEKMVEKIVGSWIRVENVSAGPESCQGLLFRRSFLYGCTLFRQSRHYAAFFTDAVISCPIRFNPEGLDNDWWRLSQLQHCLAEFHDIRVFHRKPGGFAWMHRDLRLGIRFLLESAEPIVRKDRRKKTRMLGRMRQFAASGHYWIGDWYIKAFQTTGHAAPLLEGLYHFAQCALATPEAAREAAGSDYAEPRAGAKWFDPYLRRLEYRRGLWRIGVLRLIKNLRFGRPVLKLWIEEPVAAAWFGLPPTVPSAPAGSLLSPGAGRLLSALDAAVEALCAQTRLPRHARHATPAQRKKCGEQGQALAAEWARLRPILQHELGSVVRASADRLIYSSPDGPSVGDGVFDDGDGEEEKAAWLNVADLARHEVKEARQWLRGVRAHLRKVRKAAPKGERIFLAKLEEMLAKLCQSDPPPDLHVITREFQINACLLVVEMSPQLVELIAALAYHWIRRAKLLEHADKSRLAQARHAARRSSRARSATPGLWWHPHPDPIGQAWVQACALCRIVIDFCAHLHPRHLQAEARLRIRVSALYGLALGRVHRFFEAHRRINEASALLSKDDPFRDNPPTPILEMRRAEVLILEARLLGEIAHYFAQWKRHWSTTMAKARPGIEWTEEAIGECCARNFVRGAAILPTIRKLARLRQNDDATLAKEFRPIPYAPGALPGRSTDPAKSALERAMAAREMWLLLYLQRRPEREVFQVGRAAEGYPPADWGERLYRLHIAKIDEAWMALEKSERMLAGTSQSSLWWSRLHALQLRVYAEHRFLDLLEASGSSPAYFRSLAWRHKQSHTDYVRDLFQRALGAAPGDLYRVTRMLDYFLDAHHHATVADQCLREPGHSLAQAAAEHGRQVHDLLTTARDRWCGETFTALHQRGTRDGKSRPGPDLLSAYCAFVIERYRGIFDFAPPPDRVPPPPSEPGKRAKRAV